MKNWHIIFSKMLYSWTASHISSKERLFCLEDMIKSLQLNTSAKIQISLSYEEVYKQSVGDFFNNYNKTAEIFIQPHQMKQFDHLNYLFTNFKSDEKANILFMDDDDVYLTELKTCDNKVYKGKQYIDTKMKFLDKSLDDLLNLSEEDKKELFVDEDFSGTIVPFTMVKAYFLQRKPVVIDHTPELRNREFMLKQLTETYINKLREEIKVSAKTAKECAKALEQAHKEIQKTLEIVGKVTQAAQYCKSFVANMEDIEFMNYLTDFALEYVSPVVFRRVGLFQDWSNRF